MGGESGSAKAPAGNGRVLSSLAGRGRDMVSPRAAHRNRLLTAPQLRASAVAGGAPACAGASARA